MPTYLEALRLCHSQDQAAAERSRHRGHRSFVPHYDAVVRAKVDLDAAGGGSLVD